MSGVGNNFKRLIGQLRRYLVEKCPQCGQKWARTWHWTSRVGEKAQGYFCLACPCGHEERTGEIDLTAPDIGAQVLVKGKGWQPQAIGVFRVEGDNAE